MTILMYRTPEAACVELAAGAEAPAGWRREMFDPCMAASLERTALPVEIRFEPFFILL